MYSKLVVSIIIIFGVAATMHTPMRKQGGLVLGTGGDNSDRALGIFYEGAMTSGYTSAGAESAIQDNIVAIGYKL